METTKAMTATVKGVLVSLVLMVFSLVIHFSGQTENKALGFVGMALFLAGIIWVCISYSKELDANVTFGNLFGHSFKSVATIAVLMIGFVLLMAFVIDPEMKTKSMQKAALNMASNKDLTNAQSDKAIQFTEKYFYPLMIGGSLLYYLVVGLIFSLIGAAIAKKNPQPIFN